MSNRKSSIYTILLSATSTGTGTGTGRRREIGNGSVGQQKPHNYKLYTAILAAIIIGGVIFTLAGQLPAANSNSIDSGSKIPSSETNPVIVTATATPTSGTATSAQNQISKDRNDPILGQRINNLEINGKTLMPIDSLPQEIKIGKTNLYITGMIINNKVSGYMENRGTKNINIVGDKKFTFITKDYLYSTELPIVYINGQRGQSDSNFLKAGEKKSFQTIDTLDVNEYQKIGGSKNDLLKINDLIKQSIYVQINGFSVSDA